MEWAGDECTSIFIQGPPSMEGRCDVLVLLSTVMFGEMSFVMIMTNTCLGIAGEALWPPVLCQHLKHGPV